MTVTPVDDPTRLLWRLTMLKPLRRHLQRHRRCCSTTPTRRGDGNGGLDPTSVRVTVAPTKGTAIPNNDGTVTYTPDENATGADSFTYRVCDKDEPALCDEAEVSITIAAVNDAPVANDDAETVEEDTPKT
jgi:VCBS repeat-containing protein